MIIVSPKISSALAEKYKGYIAISLEGKILGIGEDSLIALENAKKKIPDIEEKEFLVSRIHYDEVLAV